VRAELHWARVITERWLPVVDYEDLYEVSDLGNVKSKRSGKLLTPVFWGSKRPRISLYRNGKEKRRQIAQLMLEAFRGPCPPGQEVLHANDVVGDDRLENLRWGTRSENLQDMVRNGRNHWANKTHCPRNHEYTPENTYVLPSGSRACRECARIRRLEWKKKQCIGRV
jgi:hypothetical protein